MAKFGLGNLEAGLLAFEGDVHKQAKLIVRKIALDVFRGAVDRSPVISGLLKGSWNVGVNVEEKQLGAGPGASGKRFAQQIGKFKLGDTIVISNPVEYAEYVENGTPKMAPRKMLLSSAIAVRESLGE